MSLWRFKEMFNKVAPYNALKTFPISLLYDKRWAKFQNCDILKLDLGRVHLLDYLINNIKAV